MVSPAAFGGRRNALARRRDADKATSPEVLTALASDESQVVRIGVARNPLTPGPVLAALAVDDSGSIALSALGNPSLPVAVRYEVTKNSTDSDRVKLAVDGAGEAHRDALAAIFDGREAELLSERQRAAKRDMELSRQVSLAKLSTSPDELDTLAQALSEKVRATVARNPKASEYTLWRLMSDPEKRVRNSVSLNPSAPKLLRRRMVMTESDLNIVSQLIAAAEGGERDELVQLALRSPHKGVASSWSARVEKKRKQAAADKKAQPVKCPTPHKQRYYSKGKAAGQAGNASRTYDGKPFRVYRCPCGFYHMTTKVK